jgi:hypothetical protein
MAGVLAAADYLSYSGDDWTDYMGDDGHAIQEVGTFSVALARPDRLRIDGAVAGNDVTMVYDKGKVTFYERNRKLVTRTTTELGLDAYLDDLVTEYAIGIPGMDFIYTDPEESLMQWVDEGRYIGLVTLNGQACDHLAFRQEQVDWELWVEAGAQPVPRRLLIDETSSQEQFGYMATYQDWSFDALGEDTFAVDIAQGAEELSLDAFAKALEVSP